MPTLIVFRLTLFRFIACGMFFIPNIPNRGLYKKSAWDIYLLHLRYYDAPNPQISKAHALRERITYPCESFGLS